MDSNNDDAKIVFRKSVMVLNKLREWWRTPKNQRDKKQTPENVRNTRRSGCKVHESDQKRVKNKQGKQELIVWWNVAEENEKKAFVGGVCWQFTEERDERQKELQRHCWEVCTDQDVTRDVQKKRIKHFKKRGDQHFTDDGRRAEITVDLVLQAKAKMSENKVTRPEDAVVSEMIKQLLQEEVYFTTKCFQERFMGQM